MPMARRRHGGRGRTCRNAGQCRRRIFACRLRISTTRFPRARAYCGKLSSAPPSPMAWYMARRRASCGRPSRLQTATMGEPQLCSCTDVAGAMAWQVRGKHTTFWVGKSSRSWLACGGRQYVNFRPGRARCSTLAVVHDPLRGRRGRARRHQPQASAISWRVHGKTRYARGAAAGNLSVPSPALSTPGDDSTRSWPVSAGNMACLSREDGRWRKMRRQYSFFPRFTACLFVMAKSVNCSMRTAFPQTAVPGGVKPHIFFLVAAHAFNEDACLRSPQNAAPKFAAVVVLDASTAPWRRCRLSILMPCARDAGRRAVATIFGTLLKGQLPPVGSALLTALKTINLSRRFFIT